MKILPAIFGISERKRLRKRAERGDPESAYQLALLILEEARAQHGGLSDHERTDVRIYLEKAAKAGVINAAYELGRNFKELTWLRHAARNGHLDAAIELAGQAKWLGDFNDAEREEVFDLASAAREAGCDRAVDVIQDLYILEFGCSFDAVDYNRCLIHSNSKGVLIKSRLSWCYALGVGVQESLDHAGKGFEELHREVRFDPMYKCDTEGGDLWLYPPDHRGFGQGVDYAAANIAKYVVKYMGGVHSFKERLEKSDPRAQFVLYLALARLQAPPQLFEMDKMLASAAEKEYPPALYALARKLQPSDPERERLIKDSAHKGYLPAQVELARMSKDRLYKAAWTTVIFAQESFYGFKQGMERQLLDAEMEDFVLRGVGYSSRESSRIIFDPPDMVHPKDVKRFYEVLLDVYSNYVKPHKPIPKKELQSAVFNVVGYDESAFHGQRYVVGLPEIL